MRTLKELKTSTLKELKMRRRKELKMRHRKELKNKNIEGEEDESEEEETDEDVNDSDNLLGFILPLELLLLFEAIPSLLTEFREEMTDARTKCPRMCKSKFRRSSMERFTIEEINKALGKTKYLLIEYGGGVSPYL